MHTFKTLVLAGAMVAACAPRASAQPSEIPKLFLDAAVMAERDPTEFFYGSANGAAGRATVGARFSDRHAFRVEVDVPRWRVTDTSYSGPIYCAETSSCVNRPGFVPARTTDHQQVRSVSYSFLYSLQLPRVSRLQFGIVGGGAIEQRQSRSSGTFDELGASGEVIRNSAYVANRTRDWPAIVIGVDADVSLTSHLSVVPQFRLHTFPYPEVSIVRPGVAVRWTF